MPDSIALYDDGDYLPCKASAAVLGQRFVSVSGDRDANGNIQVAHTAAGGKVLGVAQFDANPADPATDGYVTVATGDGLIMPVLAGAAIAAGASVVAGAAGVAVVAAGAAGTVQHAAGIAVSGAANGAVVFVRLSPHSVTV